MGVTNEVSHELPRDIRFVMFVYEFLHTQCLTTIMKSQRGIDLKILMCKISGSYTFLLRMNVAYKLGSKVENVDSNILYVSNCVQLVRNLMNVGSRRR